MYSINYNLYLNSSRLLCRHGKAKSSHLYGIAKALNSQNNLERTESKDSHFSVSKIFSTKSKQHGSGIRMHISTKWKRTESSEINPHIDECYGSNCARPQRRIEILTPVPQNATYKDSRVKWRSLWLVPSPI